MIKTKVVFLDFNGVLDTWENLDEINKDNLLRLKTIVEKTDAKIVISSSLKNSYYHTGKISKHLSEIIKQIEHEGMVVIGITPKADTREEEIKMYLDIHPEVENFCIIDDDYYMEKFKANLVKLPPQNEIGQKGLEEKYMTMAIGILNNQENNKTFKDNTVQQLLKQESSWSNMWLEFGQRRYNYDENFKSVSDYAKENGVKKLTK